jgi:hypothetical protein
MGYGAWSDSFNFIPRYVPGKPPTPPKDVRLLEFEPSEGTNRNTIYIALDKLKEDGGWPIENYNIYIDSYDNSCDNTVFNAPYLNGNGTDCLLWNSDLLSETLKTGCYYRLKYSASNAHGEGPLSDEARILLAEVPDSPKDLERIDMTSIIAGDIRVKWQ